MKPYAGIFCPDHGKVDITEGEYIAQLEDPDSMWACPICGNESEFNDTRYEEIHSIGDEE